MPAKPGLQASRSDPSQLWCPLPAYGKHRAPWSVYFGQSTYHSRRTLEQIDLKNPCSSDGSFRMQVRVVSAPHMAKQSMLIWPSSLLYNGARKEDIVILRA